MPRSGTTLLVELLAASRSVVVAPETHAFARIPSELWERPWSKQEYVRILRRMVEYPGCHVGDALLKGLLPQPPPDDPVEFVFRVVGAHGHATAKVLIEKTPRHIEVAERALVVDPELLVTVIVRDARDVHRSLVETPWGSSDPVANAERWNRYSDIAVSLLAAFPGRVRCMKFEDLVGARDAVLGGVCGFAGIEINARSKRRGRTPVSFETDREPWKGRSTESVDTSRVERWRNDPSPDDLAILTLCRDRLATWGYET